MKPLNEIPREILETLAELSDDSLATPLSKALRGFLASPGIEDADATRRFLHELRDWAVFTGGASSFVMTFLGGLIGHGRSFPPPDTEDYGEWLARYGVRA